MCVCVCVCVLAHTHVHRIYTPFLYKDIIIFFQIGRTEMIKDCLDPEFVRKFIVDYFFEESQKLKFEL